MTELNQDDSLDLLAALKEQLLSHELDALLLPHDDEYLSGEVTADCERIATLTHFTGSAGFVCVSVGREEALPLEVVNRKDRGAMLELAHEQAVFVDGRYKVQVKEQVNEDVFDCFNLAEVTPSDYLRTLLPKKSRVGLDLRCVSYRYFQELKKELELASIEIVPLEQNLFDLVWEERPAPVCSPVEIFPDEFNGCPSLQKRKNLAQTLRDKALDATIISSPETVCWLLNIRGRDRQYLPIINSRLVAYANEALEWYINFDHLNDEIQANLEDHIGHVDIFPESGFDDVLDRLASSQCSIYVDPKTTNAHILNTLYEKGAQVETGLGLCELPKACKNATELAGEHKAHLKDGVALCRFFAWLENIAQPEIIEIDDNGPEAGLAAYQERVAELDEAVLADKVEELRKEQGEYLQPSFATISALGPNAAMCHYNHAEVATPRKFSADPLYLIDTGAHFNEGTTDITRTVLVGPNVTEQMQLMYTLVLKSHIALASTIFPRGTSGMQLDAIARRPLWEHGCDYEHGTGHGVGHVLAVHEGPQNISVRSSTVALDVGMVTSIEPGYYEADAYGIRLENLYKVCPCTQPGCQNMLCFEPLTLVPFDVRLIIREMLTPAERTWLNDYHQNVHSIIENAADLSEEELAFLKEATAPI